MQPVIHITDLFHPHEDPDDHWDIACQYALAYLEIIDFRGIVIDYPVDRSYGDPAIQAVNQLNQISNLQVPLGIGSKRKMSSEEILRVEHDAFRQITGITLIFKTLEASTEPIAIQVVGSCRDIAIAMLLKPDLFRQKCRGIYLNAGASRLTSPLEYNVKLDPFSFKVVFDAPCPIYWMPCFEMAVLPFQKGEFASFYQFRQGRILDGLSQRMQNYFLYAFKRSDKPWLTFLDNNPPSNYLAEFSPSIRNMWCTAGILHAAGLTVLRNGMIVALDDDKSSDAVFSFEAITAECHESGRVKWQLTDDLTERFIFHVNEMKHYEEAMTVAMKNILQSLP